MLLTVPVSQADKHLIPTVIKAFSLFNPGDGHDLLVVGLRGSSHLINEAQEALSPYFRSSSNLTIPQSVNLGWPREGNLLFQQAAHHIAGHYPSYEGFLWFELDCTPIKPNWLTTIQTEYYADSKAAITENRPIRRYFGSRHQTIKVLSGELVDPSKAGEHMACCGVYPNDMALTVKTLQAVPSIGFPFSYHIQWYVTPNLNPTDIIQNNWRTRNYSLNGNQVVSEDLSEHAFGFSFATPINLDGPQVLIHGCKDGSLLEIVGKGIDPNIPQAKQTSSQPPAFLPPVPAYPTILPPGVKSITKTPFTASAPQFKPVAQQPQQQPVQASEAFLKALEGVERPMNAYAAGRPSGETIPAPNVFTRESKGLPQYTEDDKPFSPKAVVTESVQDDFTPVVEPTFDEPEDSPYGNSEPPKEELLLNNKPVSPRLGVKRGTYKKRKATRVLSPEERQRRSDRMREVAKLAQKAREEKKAKQDG